MDVEKRLATDAEVLAKQVEPIDFDAYLERLFAVLDALDDPEPPSSDTEVPAGRVHAAGRPRPRRSPRRTTDKNAGSFANYACGNARQRRREKLGVVDERLNYSKP